MKNSKKRVGVYKWKVASRDLILSNVTGSTVHHGKLVHCSQKQCLNAGFGLPKSLSKERLQVYHIYTLQAFFCQQTGTAFWDWLGVVGFHCANVFYMDFMFNQGSFHNHSGFFSPLADCFFKTENLQTVKSYWNHQASPLQSFKNA